jgi:hypothetical protein
MWEPTPDWVDPVAVARALDRKPVGRALTSAERIAVGEEILRRWGHNPYTGKLSIDPAKFLGTSSPAVIRAVMRKASARTGIPLRVEPQRVPWAA